MIGYCHNGNARIYTHLNKFSRRIFSICAIAGMKVQVRPV
jgi:hypothetical protein